MSEPLASEIADTIQTLRRELETLIVRGLRSVGPSETARLAAMQEELARVGAHHLAQRLAQLLDQVRADHRDGPAALMRTMSSLRVFERVLTLDTVAGDLEAAVARAEAAEE